MSAARTARHFDVATHRAGVSNMRGSLRRGVRTVVAHANTANRCHAGPLRWYSCSQALLWARCIRLHSEHGGKQYEHGRTRGENRRHAGGRQKEQRHYPGGVQKAPDAPRPTVHPAQGPLNDKARCEDDCYNKYIIDSGHCSKLPKPKRRRCQDEASEKMSLCFRECSRKYPGK